MLIQIRELLLDQVERMSIRGRIGKIIRSQVRIRILMMRIWNGLVRPLKRRTVMVMSRVLVQIFQLLSLKERMPGRHWLLSLLGWII